jgi:drug/metabolite transporter (DMT)-like permease
LRKLSSLIDLGIWGWWLAAFGALGGVALAASVGLHQAFGLVVGGAVGLAAGVAWTRKMTRGKDR